MSIENSLQIMGPKIARDSFKELAQQSGVDVNLCIPQFQTGQVINCDEYLKIIFSKESAAMVASFCGVIVAWLAVRPVRKISLTLFADGRIKSLDARAYSKDELIEIVPHCQKILVYDKQASPVGDQGH